MGWGPNRFPLLAHLNAVTASPVDRGNTHAFFVNHFGPKGDGVGGVKRYELGDLCAEWPNGWPGWNPVDARDWRLHCQHDLNVPNTGTGSTMQTVRADLERWITDALLAQEQIVYRYVRAPGSFTWKADLTRRGSRWHIVVSGPGF